MLAICAAARLARTTNGISTKWSGGGHGISLESLINTALFDFPQNSALQKLR
jgi:hypothetical protein